MTALHHCLRKMCDGSICHGVMHRASSLFPHGGVSARTARHFDGLSPAGAYLRAQPVRGCLSQSAAPLRAFRGICCAEPIGFVYEELQQQNARSSPFENLPAIPGAARANIRQCGSSGRADSPCSGRTDSFHDSEPDLWKWDLDVARN